MLDTTKDPMITCQSCGREWQDHPGVQHCCKLTVALAEHLRWALKHVEPPEYRRDLTEMEVFYQFLEESKRLIVEASGWRKR